MNKNLVIEKTAKYVKSRLESDSSGHDWWHVYRVWKTAVKIGKEEKADLFVIELAALLHDIADFKFHGGDDNIGPRTAKEWLEKLEVDKKTISQVCKIIYESGSKSGRAEYKIKNKD